MNYTERLTYPLVYHSFYRKKALLFQAHRLIGAFFSFLFGFGWREIRNSVTKTQKNKGVTRASDP